MTTESDDERVTDTNFGNLLSKVAVERRAAVLSELRRTIDAEREQQEHASTPDYLLAPVAEPLPSGQKKAPEPH